MTTPKIVLDSNIFVAAGFSRRSHSARLLDRVRAGELRLMWHEATVAETRHQLEKIPPLSWQPVAVLFAGRNQFAGELPLADYLFIADPDDRKFAALAEQVGALLVTNDEHLLSAAARLTVPVLTPAAAVAWLSAGESP